MSLAALRKAVMDDRIHVCAAVVDLHDGETLHYFVNDEGDLVVSCRTLKNDIQVNANLGALLGTNGRGVWYIPDVGTEVMLAFDNGDFEGEAYIIGSFPSGTTPENLAPGRIFIQGMEVVVRSPNGTANKLPTLEDLQGVVTYLQKQFDTVAGHTHAGVGAPPTEGLGGVGDGSAPDPVGTTVLKAE